MIPRNEYPRPQMVREEWMCLNGEWDFEIDAGDSGKERGLIEKPLSGRITVPFCPESELSGIGNTDFMNAVWYRRTFRRPAAWRGRDVLLHFQAVDYEATVWGNGAELARHRGGFTPFCCVLPDADEVTLVVRARDLRNEVKPCGKQTFYQHNNACCNYIRTTGIWQTVWAEPVAKCAFERPRITPRLDRPGFDFLLPLRNRYLAQGMKIVLRMAGETLETAVGGDFTPMLEIRLRSPRTWSPEDPHLYDWELTLFDGDKAVDRIYGYCGLRSVAFEGRKVLLNGKAAFQRLVLDQGYYPDGIMTAPSDEALERDIIISKAAGFNGARLHQKVFEERFLYHADRLGYLVWGEYGDWGMQFAPMTVPNPEFNQPFAAMFAQWSEALARDFNHPSIIGWCPLNETSRRKDDNHQALADVTAGLYNFTKLADPTRPVIDVSGYCHCVHNADICDCHDYTQDVGKFKTELENFFMNSTEFINSVPYAGQPYFCSEFGGIKWNPAMLENSGESWGYGDAPKTLDEFYSRFAGLCRAQLDNPELFGYCYTQLTDVFQEQNGVYNFNRTLKFPVEPLREAQITPAAVEKK